MSTRSVIGIYKNGKARGIYCHSDGYIGYTGVILDCFYSSDKAVMSLLTNYTSLSSVGPIDDKERADAIAKKWDYSTLSTPKGKSWELCGGMFTKGRYDEGDKPDCYWEGDSPEVLCDEVYAYVWDSVKQMWYVKGSDIPAWTPLKQAILREMQFENGQLTASCSFKPLFCVDIKVNSLLLEGTFKPAYEHYRVYLKKMASMLKRKGMGYDYESFAYNVKVKKQRHPQVGTVYDNYIKARVKGVDKTYPRYLVVEYSMVDNSGNVRKYEDTTDKVEFVTSAVTESTVYVHTDGDYTEKSVILTNPSKLQQLGIFRLTIDLPEWEKFKLKDYM